METYAQDVERSGDDEFAELFRRAHGESSRGGEQAKQMLARHFSFRASRAGSGRRPVCGAAAAAPHALQRRDGFADDVPLDGDLPEPLAAQHCHVTHRVV